MLLEALAGVELGAWDRRIIGLHANAASTGFPEEADACRAKAEQLRASTAFNPEAGAERFVTDRRPPTHGRYDPSGTSGD
jgi:hypothetical protein